MSMGLKILPAYEHEQEIKELFTEYTTLLVEQDAEFAKYLELQDYEAELADIRVKYGMPDGRLYIAMVDGQAAGCIGMHKIDENMCEMKRLYVRPKFRGRKIAKKLVDLVLQEAKTIGYEAMLLDTLPFLKGAIALYRKYGFHEIPCYNNSPMKSSIYMQLDLEKV